MHEKTTGEKERKKKKKLFKSRFLQVTTSKLPFFHSTLPCCCIISSHSCSQDYRRGAGGVLVGRRGALNAGVDNQQLWTHREKKRPPWETRQLTRFLKRLYSLHMFTFSCREKYKISSDAETLTMERIRHVVPCVIVFYNERYHWRKTQQLQNKSLPP